MTYWQLALLVTAIALSQVAFALFYLRPKMAIAPPGSRYAVWRPLLVLGLFALLISLILLVFPDTWAFGR
jgi:hypothetical protein